MSIELNIIHHSDCLAGLVTLPDNSVDCCVTSPPYYALRDYGHGGQIGLEDTPEEFITKMVEVFGQVRRVLKPTGTCWVNMGDSYWGGKGKSGSQGKETQQLRNESGASFTKPASNTGGKGKMRPTDGKHPVFKPKDMMMIPFRLAIALQESGWYVRQDIIWSKPNPMPESIRDRFTKSHEYIFMLTKSAKYYFDQASILEPVSPNTHMRVSQKVAEQIGSSRANGGERHNGPMKAVTRKRHEEVDTKGGNQARGNIPFARKHSPKACANEFGVKSNESFEAGTCLPVTERNKRTVWTVGSRGFTEAHFATYPEELIVPCIKAGCPPGGIVLDPFMGAATTAVVARKLGRNYIGFELNPDYIAIANRRLEQQLGPLDKLFT